MKVAIYSRTALAAAPWELYKVIKKYTDIDVSLINRRIRYADGRQFPYHLIMQSNNGIASEVMFKADLWHIHNYLDPDILSLRLKKPIVAQFHSLPRQGNWRDLMRVATICYTIRQPLQIREYVLPGLPNLIDPDEYRPGRRQGKIKIAFAPSSKAPVGSLQSKGYFEIQPILNSVAMKRDVEIYWIENQSYLKNLELKSQCHILIDDVVTGNWHRTSLEGMCFACAVINRIDQEPFVYASLETLEKELIKLIDDTNYLKEVQERSRLWILQNWHPIDLVKEYTRVYKGVLDGKNEA